MIKVFEAFSGYGSQALALKRFGIEFESVGIAEIDKYAIAAHESLHGPVKNYGDISQIDTNDLPDMDLFTYSFPCQDISVAGKQRGLEENSGTRSSLLWECEKVIDVKRPKFLMMENVKNLVGKKNKPHFDRWLNLLENYGYNNYWKVINAKFCGIPQNRERVFCVSILKEYDTGSFCFEEDFDSGVRLKDVLESEVDEKYYISQEKCDKLISQIKCNKKGSLPNDLTKATCSSALSSREHRASGWKDIVGTLCARDYKDPKVVCIPCITPDRVNKRQNGRRFKEDGDPMFTLTSQDRHGILQVSKFDLCIDDTQGFDGVRLYNGISPTLRSKRHGLKVFDNEIIKVGDVKSSYEQSGRVYDPNGIAPTVMGNSHGKSTGGYTATKVAVKEATKKGYAVATVGDSINMEQPNSKTRRGRVGVGVAQTLTTSCNQATIIPEEFYLKAHNQKYADACKIVNKEGGEIEVYDFYNKSIKYDIANTITAHASRQDRSATNIIKRGENFRIRKLTPKECFRLMGLRDDEIDKIQATIVNNKPLSNSQQYKMAGNSIVVDAMKFLKNLNN